LCFTEEKNVLVEELFHLDNFYKLLLLYSIMQLDKAIESRESIRKYTSKKPNWRKIIESIDMARYAPMAGGINSIKFILVDDKEKINQIAKSCDQDFVGTAQYIVVVCSTTSLVTNSYGKLRGERYLRQQAGAAIENFLLKLTENNLSTCWVGHFMDSQIKKTLKIPEEVIVEAVFPIGFKNEKRTSKKKIDLDNILYFNEYENKKMIVPKRS